ncbi:MAG TPA: FHA domain-containing protein [Methanomicrobiales archaeon]|nr:FHA domain-containing protein [Methanomicrobiales archaeon]
MGRDGASDTIAGLPDRDLIDELSGYLDVLSSNARLRILRLLATKPMDATAISREIGTSYENTKKHLDRLLSIGLIRKEAGIGRETSKGVHPVWEYSVVPGSLEAIIRTLGVFSNLRITALDRDLDRQLSSVKGGVSGVLLGERPMVILMGGPEDGKGFTLGDGETRIGRRDPGLPGAGDPARDIILGDAYQAVTRVSRPHAKIRVGGGVFFEDCGSTGGSSLNGTKLAEGEGARLRNGDVLELGKGNSAARLILAIPPALDLPSGTERPAGDGATHHARRT